MCQLAVPHKIFLQVSAIKFNEHHAHNHIGVYGPNLITTIEIGDLSDEEAIEYLLLHSLDNTIANQVISITGGCIVLLQHAVELLQANFTVAGITICCTT